MGRPRRRSEGGEEIVAGEVEVDRFLRVGTVDDVVGDVEGTLAGQTAAQVALQDGVVNGGEVAVDVAAEHVPEAVAELLVAGDGAVGALPLPIGVGVEDEAALEDGLRDRAEGVVDDPVSERGCRDHAVFRVEDLDHRVAARPVAARPEFPFEAQGFLLQIGEKGGCAGFAALAFGGPERRLAQGREAGDRVEEVTRSCGHDGPSSRRRSCARSRQGSGRRARSGGGRGTGGRGRGEAENAAFRCQGWRG